MPPTQEERARWMNRGKRKWRKRFCESLDTVFKEAIVQGEYEAMEAVEGFDMLDPRAIHPVLWRTRSEIVGHDLLVLGLL